MPLFKWFKSKTPQETLLRCTNCDYELEYTDEELKQMTKHAKQGDPCPFMDPCHICHTGFMIPVHYQTEDGRLFLFKEIKPLVKNLDPDTAWRRIYGHNE